MSSWILMASCQWLPTLHALSTSAVLTGSGSNLKSTRKEWNQSAISQALVDFNGTRIALVYLLIPASRLCIVLKLESDRDQWLPSIEALTLVDIDTTSRSVYCSASWRVRSKACCHMLHCKHAPAAALLCKTFTSMEDFRMHFSTVFANGSLFSPTSWSNLVALAALGPWQV